MLIECGDGSAAQPALDGGVEQAGFIDVPKYFVDGLSGDVRAHTELLDMLQDASPPVSLDGGVGAGAGERDAAIVDRAVGGEARQGPLDLVGGELFAGKPIAELPSGEFAARQEGQRARVRIH